MSKIVVSIYDMEEQLERHGVALVGSALGRRLLALATAQGSPSVERALALVDEPGLRRREEGVVTGILRQNLLEAIERGVAKVYAREAKEALVALDLASDRDVQAAEVERLRGELERAAEQVDAWKDASGLECGGDPDGVTPAAMKRYWESVESRAEQAEARVRELEGEAAVVRESLLSNFVDDIDRSQWPLARIAGNTEALVDSYRRKGAQ